MFVLDHADGSGRRHDPRGLSALPGEGLRVVVSNDPLSYREAMAAALRQLRPGIEVTVAEPDRLGEALSRVGPDVVLCSRATALVEVRVPVWIELYPGGERMAVVSAEGSRSRRPDINLREILAIVDRAQRRKAQGALRTS